MVVTAESELVLELRPAAPPEKTIAWNKLRERLARDLTDEGLAAFSCIAETQAGSTPIRPTMSCRPIST
jgi:hypothetical protein